MKCNLISAAIMASLMIIFAVLARLGLADRTTVEILLIVFPVIAVSHVLRQRACCDDGVAKA